MIVLIDLVTEDGGKKGGKEGGRREREVYGFISIKESNVFGCHIEALLPLPPAI